MSSSSALDELPDELILEIALYLPALEIVQNLCLVSSRFCEVLDADYVWQRFTERELGSSLAADARAIVESWKLAYLRVPFFTFDRLEVYARNTGCWHYQISAAIIFRAGAKCFRRVEMRHSDEAISLFKNFRDELVSSSESSLVASRCKCPEVDSNIVTELLSHLRTRYRRSGREIFIDILDGEIVPETPEAAADGPIFPLKKSDFVNIDETLDCLNMIRPYSTTRQSVQLRLYSRRSDGSVFLEKCLEHFQWCPWMSPWYVASQEHLAEMELGKFNSVVWLRQHEDEQVYGSKSMVYHRGMISRDPLRVARLYDVRIGFLVASLLEKGFAMLSVLSGRSVFEWIDEYSDVVDVDERELE